MASMDFNLTTSQHESQERAQAFARDLSPSTAAHDIVAGAVRARVLHTRGDLLSAVIAVEALGWESAGAAVALAMQAGVTMGLEETETSAQLARGEIVGSIALSSDEVPVIEHGSLSRRASWVTPLTEHGLVIVG